MRRLNCVVNKEDDGRNIKEILKKEFSLSASVLKELKKTPGSIRCNGEEVFAVHIAKADDKIEIILNDKKSPSIEPSNVKIDVIYEDDDILVVNKPRSMPTHPSQNHHSDSLASAVMNYYRDLPFTFRVITRLDKDTSGVVVIAKNKLSAAILTNQMTKGQIEKEYLALCHGVPQEKSGTIDASIARLEGSSILRTVNPNGKSAITHFEVLEDRGETSILRIYPRTGRTHQIRVHLSHIGHPIYGDDMYGSDLKDEKTRLHCQKISLMHPINKENISFTAPIPQDMQ